MDLVMNYNDYFLNNSLLTGNHFPPVAIALVMALVVGINAAARRWWGVAGLSPGELVLIWAMVGIGGGICGAGVMRYFPSWMVCPAYYVTPGNDYGPTIVADLAPWMVVSTKPNDPAVRWFMEGLPRGAAVPWGAWVRPLAVWGAFVIMLFAATFALVAFFYYQWSARERLIFPLIQVPLMVSAEPAPGRALNAFLTSRMAWAGAGVPLLLWGFNGLANYLPGLPRIPTTWDLGTLFPDRPWSEFHVGSLQLYFTAVGMTYLLTVEMGFSLWVTYLLFRLSFVFVAWLGAGATGFFGGWESRVKALDTAGAMLAIAVFLVWSARAALREWWGRLRAGTSDAERDPLPPRLTLLLGAGGAAGMVGWLVLGRVQPWVAVATIGFFLVVLLILTRVVAESGLFYVMTEAMPADVVTALVPPAAVTGPSLTGLMMTRAILMHDLREILMPFLMNGVAVASAVRLHLRKVMAVFALTVLVALAISAYARISTAYKYGGVNLDSYANIEEPGWVLEGVATFRKTPPSFDWLEVGGARVLPVNLAHLLTGALLAAGMLVLRARFLWWPLHPFGLVMCGSWAIDGFWFSILLGNAIKAAMMTFGGASAYRRWLPFFLGLILGESLISVFWTLVGLATGVPGRPILPN